MKLERLATLFVLVLPAVAPWAAHAADEPAVYDLGDRLELFVDDTLIDEITGEAELYLHKPVPKEVVLVTDEPWEGNTSAYYTIFQDGPLYRMYYRGSHFDEKTRKATHPQVVCYAESSDGVNWTKPKLGLIEFDGSKENNIVAEGLGSHNFAPFKDANPDCHPGAKYKAMGSGKAKAKRGLFAFKSPDAIHWSLMADEPVITKGAFDSQNLAFWDPASGVYRAYWRIFTSSVTTGKTSKPGGFRAIRTATSENFLDWGPHADLTYGDAPDEHLYTNAICPYPRAPHILIGFPTRYHPERGSQVEPTLMASRDGHTFHRWLEPVIPVTAPKDRDGNRSNYMAWGLVQLPGNKKECSVYASEAYYTGPDSRLRRFTYRVDGFVSLRALPAGGQLITKPLVFDGKQLVINFATSGAGSVRVEIQDAAGTPIPGFTLADSSEITGDQIEQVVTWKQGPTVSKLAGRPVRLRFVLKDGDVYSYRFAE